MTFLRAAAFFLLPALVASAYNPGRPAPEEFRFEGHPVYFAATAPLADIPVYQLQPDATSGDSASKALGAEIERLYTHAKTLPSGHDRRALETRIYLFEKRLRPIVQSFELKTWEALRTDVRAEWVAVQASLPVSVASVQN